MQCCSTAAVGDEICSTCSTVEILGGVTISNLKNFTPKQKAAILLISLPPEISAQVFRSFPPEEVQALTLEMSKLPTISPEVRAAIIDEFFKTVDMSQLTNQTSGSFSTDVESRVDEVKTEVKVEDTPSSVLKHRPLDFLRKVDPRQVYTLIKREHPQTIALILSYLQPAQASAILVELPPALQTEVARRLAEIGRISPEVLKEVEDVLESRLYSMVEGDYYYEANGKEALVEILSQADRGMEEEIISGLTKKNPRLASQIKNQLCEFSDLTRLDENSLQQVLRVTDIRDLVFALKGASREIAEKIYNCMSSEAAKALKEDVDALGKVDWEEIKAAQQQIRNNLRGLITIGKIKLD